MSDKILFVDDDPRLLASLERVLRRQFNFETALGGEAALEIIKQRGPFAVVVSDRQMPKMDGIEFLSRVRDLAPDTVRIMLTGNIDLEQAVRAVNEGHIFSFLIKPCPTEVLSQTLKNAVAQHRLIIAEKELLDQTLKGSIKLLTDILSMVDAKSFGHAEKLRTLVASIAAKMPLANSWEISVAAMLSPIGTVTLPSETILKARNNEALSRQEETLISSTPEIAARLLANIPRLEGVSQIVRYQRKQFDGGGWPRDDVHGPAIPLGARLLKILNDMLELQASGLSQSKSLNDLSLRQGWYDQALLDSVKIAFGVIEAQTRQSWVVISVPPPDLAVGMILDSDLRTKDGLLILSSGHLISQMNLERIQNFHLIYGLNEPILVRVQQYIAEPVPAPNSPPVAN